MAPSKKRRFQIVDDLEAKRAREAAALEPFANVELDDSPEVTPKVQERRDAYMQEWREYVETPCLFFPVTVLALLPCG